MKAIGFTEHLPIDNPHSLYEFQASVPNPHPHDLLVNVAASSVNPVDTYIRKGGRGKLKSPKIIGYDACGIVIKAGAAVTLFKPGDRVFYAGSILRPGSNSEYQLVDERIVGHAPQTLSDAQAAVMPLTSLTAYEALFEQLGISQSSQTNSGKTILIINGTGGAGSVATQLAHLAGLTVIATASHPKGIQWTTEHGAQLVVNHHQDLVKQVRSHGYKYVDYILGLSNIDAHWKEMCQLIKPNGSIVSITENRRPINLSLLTKKRAHFAWEWMYTKSYYSTPDMITQHQILDRVAQLLDDHLLSCTLTKELTPFTAANLRQGHRLVESGHMIGKVAISGWK